MIPAIIEFAKSSRRKFPFASGRVLEVGSRDVNGTVRPAFADATEYIGVDAADGRGVDRVLDAHDVLATFGPESFDTVVCCEMLEHDPQPWLTVPQLHAILKPGGHLLVTTPTFGFPLHRHPKDYWRFGEDAYREFIFAGLEILELSEVRGAAGNPILCCLGRKPGSDRSAKSERTPSRSRTSINNPFDRIFQIEPPAPRPERLVESIDDGPALTEHGSSWHAQRLSSHRLAWIAGADVKNSSILIIAAGAAFHPHSESLFGEYWSAVPDDWDIVLLGAYYNNPPTHLTGHCFIPADLAAIHGYAIRRRACVALLQSDPANSWDAAVRGLQQRGKFNIYSLWPNLVCPRARNNGAPQEKVHDSAVTFEKLGRHGGFGNQLFQIAATLGAAARHGYRPQFPTWDCARFFQSRLDHSLDSSRISARHIERHFHYAEIPHRADLNLEGFFQSPRYFHGYEHVVRMFFQPENKLSAELAERYRHLLQTPTVAVHMRRGNYLRTRNAFCVLPVEYYQRAMSQFDTSYRFAIFSDDPDWCRATFRGPRIEVIDGNSNVQDLFLMSMCRHFIIANSTFSWWGAWLGTFTQKRVIAPRAWFGPALSSNNTRDLFPSHWEILGA